jgi:hypothetical protein
VPDEIYVRPRAISRRWVEWTIECNQILDEHKEVQGSLFFDTRPSARWRAMHLIRLLVDLRLKHRWELSEHTWQRTDGKWGWSVRLIERLEDARQPVRTGPAYR